MKSAATFGPPTRPEAPTARSRRSLWRRRNVIAIRGSRRGIRCFTVISMSALFYTHVDDSPVGPLLLAGDSEALHVLAFGIGSRPRDIDADWLPDTKGVLKLVRR